MPHIKQAKQEYLLNVFLTPICAPIRPKVSISCKNNRFIFLVPQSSPPELMTRIVTWARISSWEIKRPILTWKTFCRLNRICMPKNPGTHSLQSQIPTSSLISTLSRLQNLNETMWTQLRSKRRHKTCLSSMWRSGEIIMMEAVLRKRHLMQLITTLLPNYPQLVRKLSQLSNPSSALIRHSRRM